MVRARTAYWGGPSRVVSSATTLWAARKTAISAASWGLAASTGLAQAGAVAGVHWWVTVSRIWSASSATSTARPVRQFSHAGSLASKVGVAGSQRSGPIPAECPPVGSMRQSSTAAGSWALKSSPTLAASVSVANGSRPSAPMIAKCLQSTGHASARVNPG